jgi:hypothetical protein
MASWATVTVADSTGKRYSLDVEADSTYDAAHLFLTHAKEHVIREPLPIPSLDTTFEVSVNGRVHKVPGEKLQKGEDHEAFSSASAQCSVLKAFRGEILFFKDTLKIHSFPTPAVSFVDYSVTIAALHPSGAPVRSGERSIFDTACPKH